MLRERDRAGEAWLRNEVIPEAQALRDDPSRALSTDEVRAELKNLELATNDLARSVRARSARSASEAWKVRREHGRSDDAERYVDSIADFCVELQTFLARGVERARETRRASIT
ncbi:hypothetical protein [Caballeronia pedi]|uniref:hypothetical protein n=1 Tax=Caballeronia pedi TaxID=1777141 RepID=UPI000B1DC917